MGELDRSGGRGGGRERERGERQIFALSRVEMIERTCNTYIRKWLGLPRTINTSSLYRRKGALQLPLISIVEINKAGKVRTVMMLRESRD